MYGYKIVNGKAVIDEAEREIMMSFIGYYLDGFSIKKSKEMSGIGFASGTLRHLLDNETYLGTDFYPPIIEEALFNRIAIERASRTHGATRSPDPVQPVYRNFAYIRPAELPGDPALAAQLMYDSIKVSSVAATTTSFEKDRTTTAA